ncbi:hypothetical protein BBF96_14285 [Anoxybacter fermentans]|uniref:Haloacid dehalogenase n=1 Tax=Anoxybacter fermentans TaxID=1323375 RepID=A0A3Q9HST3_9FIRM|nr:HAD family hydrolase [Anoxybacter fermentans]AZR74453.1 hypothetical protein BBF96_14285 [Anoxybacter fermentans]
MKYRLIVSDIDGTLTEVWDQVNDRNRQVLKRLVKKGVAFMIATGRSFKTAESILKSLDIPCYACLMNGAVLLSYPERKLIYTNYISVDEKNLIMEKIQKFGGHAVIYNGYERGDKIYYNENYRLNPVLDKIINSSINRRIQVGNMIKDINHPVPVISCVGEEEEIDTIQNLLEPYQDKFNILKLKENYYEDFFWLMITRKGVDKVHGIKYVAKQLRIRREEIIAIGDDLNDLEMIKYAGLGIAMENGVDELKAVADMIAPPCTEDGMALILEEIYSI